MPTALITMVIRSESHKPESDVYDFSEAVESFANVQGLEGDLGAIIAERGVSVQDGLVQTLQAFTLVSEVRILDDGTEDEVFVEATWIIACNEGARESLIDALPVAFPDLVFDFDERYFGEVPATLRAALS